MIYLFQNKQLFIKIALIIMAIEYNICFFILIWIKT